MFTTRFTSSHAHGTVRDLYSEGISKNSKFVATASGDNSFGGTELDISSLPAAAEALNISPDIRDYILVPVPTVVSRLPNTNGDSMSNEELLRWNVQQGRIAYKTWIGKSVYVEHANTLVAASKGLILDSYLKAMPQYGDLVRVNKLLAIDRTKDAQLANAVLRNMINTYSMGVNYYAYRCSITGRVFTSEDTPGEYTEPNRPPYMVNVGGRQRLSYRSLLGLEGFETSAVTSPAYYCALSDVVVEVRNNTVSNFSTRD